MQRKELNGKPLLRDEPGLNEQPFERPDSRQFNENTSSENLPNKNTDPAEMEGDRLGKNDDEGMRGN